MLHVYRQITGLSRYRPVVFTQKREHAVEFPFNKVVVVPRPVTRELRRFWQKKIRRAPVTISRAEAHRLAVQIARSNARLLHIYFGHIGVHLRRFIELRPLPIIVSFHGADAMVDMDKPRHLEAMRAMLGQVTLALARSHTLADQLADLGCAREKIRIHRTGIPLDRFPFAHREAPPDGAWRLLQACRLIEKKGIATSLRAFAEFVKAWPLATFTIAGEGPLLADLQSISRELGVAENVRFAGFVPQEKLCGLCRASHFFLHPSERGRDGNQEGVPNSMLEAMATGLPALATMHGGIPEAVENGVSGVLVAERDSAALAGGMIELSREPERYRQMSEAAAKSVTERFELGAQVRALEGFYDEAVG